MPKPVYEFFSENIPAELKNRPQWVGWRFEKRKGKWTKPPINIHTGCGAKSNDPATWSTFGEAVAYWQANKGRIDGVGYVLTEDDPYCLIDFDEVVTDRIIDPQVRKIVDTFNTYTEKSVSGDGLHLICQATKPGDKCRAKVSDTVDVEFYSEKRYFTVTGNALKGMKTIQPCGNEVSVFYRKYFEEKKKEGETIATEGEGKREGSAPGPPSSVAIIHLTEPQILEAIEQQAPGLYGGDTGRYPSASEADAALAQYILYWTGGDSARTAGLMKKSGLYRDKWDSKRKASNYLEVTIAQIRGKMTCFYTGATCKFCQKPIIWKGKTPHNPDETPHNCAVCRDCGKPIIFKKRKPHNLDGKRHHCTTQTKANGSSLPSWAYKSDGKVRIVKGACADAFFDQKAGNLLFSQQSFWAWTEQIWEQDEGSKIRSEIRRFIKNAVGNEPLTAAVVNDIFEQLKMVGYAKAEFDQHKNLIALQNGVLDTETLEFIPHSREFMQTILLGFDYDSTAKAPRWTRILEGWKFKNSTIDRLQEWYGYSLVPTAKLEKCLFIYGGGGNGKGLYLNALLDMLKGNTVSIEPKDLFGRFQLLSLRGKLINACTDISTSEAISAQFKQVVSGEQVTCDVKHKDHVTFCPIAKHLFSANKLLVTRDRSYGFFRRFDVLEFTQTWDESEKDEDLRAYFRENELPGIFNWAIEGLRRLRRNKWKFTPSSEFQSSHKKFQLETNPLAMFVEEHCEFITCEYLEKIDIPAIQWEAYSKTHSVPTDALRESYVVFCNKNGYTPLSAVHVGRQLSGLPQGKRVDLHRKYRYPVPGKKEYYYQGLLLL